MNVWIATEFEWKLQTMEHFDEETYYTMDSSVKEILKNPNFNPMRICQFEIEITLAKSGSMPIWKSWMKKLKLSHHQINEALLVDEAFQPKRYTVKLEKGNFLCGLDAMSPNKVDEFTQRFGLRLSFDKSPYPPQQEWKQTKRTPEAMKVWEWKEFYAWRLPRPKAPAENEDPREERCVLS